MKYLGIIGLIIGITSCDPFSDESPSNKEHRLPLFSNILQQERQISIYLPDSYDSTGKTRYPILYVLDGGGSLDADIAENCQRLLQSDSIPSVIVVGIPNMSKENRERQLVPPFLKIDHKADDSPLGEGDKFLDFIEKELIPFVESKVYASEERMFFGNSRGGLLVMYSLMKTPDLFQTRFCYSTPFWREQNRFVQTIDKFLEKTDTLNTLLYLRVGENETENIRDGNVAMASVLKERTGVGLECYLNNTANADHQTNAALGFSHDIKHWGNRTRHRSSLGGVSGN